MVLSSQRERTSDDGSGEQEETDRQTNHRITASISSPHSEWPINWNKSGFIAIPKLYYILWGWLSVVVAEHKRAACRSMVIDEKSLLAMKLRGRAREGKYDDHDLPENLNLMLHNPVVSRLESGRERLPVDERWCTQSTHKHNPLHTHVLDMLTLVPMGETRGLSRGLVIQFPLHWLKNAEFLHIPRQLIFFSGRQRTTLPPTRHQLSVV